MVEVGPREVRRSCGDLREKGLAPRTVTNVFVLLRRFFGDLEADESIANSRRRLRRDDRPKDARRSRTI